MKKQKDLEEIEKDQQETDESELEDEIENSEEEQETQSFNEFMSNATIKEISPLIKSQDIKPLESLEEPTEINFQERDSRNNDFERNFEERQIDYSPTEKMDYSPNSENIIPPTLSPRSNQENFSQTNFIDTRSQMAGQIPDKIYPETINPGIVETKKNFFGFEEKDKYQKAEFLDKDR